MDYACSNQSVPEKSAGMHRCNMIWMMVAVLVTSIYSDVTVNRIFTNNMVLQHGIPAPIWGKANAGENVSVEFNGRTKSTTADANGTWKVTLDTLPIINSSLQMVVRGTNTITLTNVLVGDVWLCAGQSNMEFTVIDFGYNPNVEAVTMTKVRLFTLKNNGAWSECNPGSAGGFSAVAFFYAKHLYDSLKIPLGIIVGAIGATCVEQWMSPQSVSDDQDPTLATFRCSYCGGDTINNIDPKKVSGLYRIYIEPLIPLAIRGVAWYQGEWNTFIGNGTNQPEKYHVRFKELIAGWRAAWQQNDLPFYFVQLPNYYSTGMNWALIREAQRLTLKEVDHTGMAIAIDLGDSVNIHPLNKRSVGHRLALIALEKTYGHSTLVSSGPLFRNFYVHNDTAHLSFDYTGSGLDVKNGALTGFEIAPHDSDFVSATASLRNDEVIVYKPGSKVVNVRYAWTSNPHPTLYNKEGLPASPFRTYTSDVTGIKSNGMVGGPIRSGKPDRMITAIKVFDMSGRCVAVFDGKSDKSLVGWEVADVLQQCRNLSRGVYIVQRKMGETTVIEKRAWQN